MIRSTTNRRLLGLYVGLLAGFGVLWVRCVWLQVLHTGRLSSLARAQHRTHQVLLGARGTIYDRDGEVLAMSVPVPSVYANPRRMKANAAKPQLAAQISKMTGKDASFIRRRLDRDRGFVWLARQVDPGMHPQLASLLHQGIGMREEPKRMYPHGGMAAHLLGHVNIDEQGLEGLELAMNGTLHGQPGWRSTLRDAKGDLLIGPWTTQIEPEPGYDVVLTIDGVVQGVAEEALAWGVKAFHAKGGSLIIVEPSTGAILALANQPGFDPNHPGNASADKRRNRAVTDMAEPGSVFKIVTASALLEEGLVRLDEQIFCEHANWATVGHHVLHDHTPHGWLSFEEVIKYSSNIGTSKFAQRLPPETLYRYIRAFGFGRKTGVDLPGEVSGMIAPPARWSKLSPYIIPIGQEVATTPIQLAEMMAIVANGGWVVRPYLIDRIQDADGRVIRRFPPQPRGERLLSDATIQSLNQILSQVVQSGTGQLANIQGLTVAGKTGTAQKLEPNGRYSHSRYVASFVGYGPVPDSRFAMVVVVDEPHPYYGGTVAAPIFRRVVQQLQGYWQLAPAAPILAKLP
jgi:cell division protein FtsI (penicillin-binding protein 3)